MTTVRATTSFRAPGVTVKAGDLFDDADPLVTGREHLFEALDAARVRTTATVPAPPTEPPPFLPAGRPAGNASRDTWADYVVSLGGDPADLGQRDLRALADQLEGCA